MMTRKHYRAIAEALARARPPNAWPSAKRQWLDIQEAIAETLQHGNERFDRERFDLACDPEDGKE